MKKIAYIILGAAVLTACDKYYGEWSGSYNYGEDAGCEYMLRIADNLIVDNLKQMDLALYIDGQTASSSTRFERSGSLWAEGSQWTVTKRGGTLAGLKITKDAADSTWTLTRSDKYSFSSYDSDNYSYDTAYEMELRMLPVPAAYAVKDHHWWRVTLKSCTRTEDGGYKSVFLTPEASGLEYTYGSMDSWSSCVGELVMKVYKEGELIDVARLRLNGSQYNYLRNL